MNKTTRTFHRGPPKIRKREKAEPFVFRYPQRKYAIKKVIVAYAKVHKVTVIIGHSDLLGLVSDMNV